MRGEEGSFVGIGVKSLNGYEHDKLFRNLGPAAGGDGSGEAGVPRFADVAYVEGSDRLEDGRAIGVTDVDGDGRLDVIGWGFEGEALLLINRSPVAGHWLALDLVGTRSNRDAIGARVTVTAGNRTLVREVSPAAGYVSTQSRIVHLGLGEAAVADRIEVRWPSGARTVLRDVAVDRRVTITEPTDAAWRGPSPSGSGRGS